MWKALAYKELRESLGIAVLALVAFLIATSGATRQSLGPVPGFDQLFQTDHYGIPFVTASFPTNFTVISAIMVIALGYRQSLGESRASGYLFLLHRPIARESIFAVKLIVGAVTYLVVAAIPILLYTWWAATPGNHASPFEYSMTLPVWQIYISMPVIYFGAFLSGLQPARWRGTKLGPLITATAIVFVIQVFPFWWMLGIGSLVLLGALYVANIVFVCQTRDFA